MSEGSPLSKVVDDLESHIRDCNQCLLNCTDEAALAELKARFLGTRGIVTELMKGLKSLPIEDRKIIGAKTNQAKATLEELFKSRAAEIRQRAVREELEASWIDPTYRESNRDLGLNSGGLHPLTMVQREAEDLFYGMGFEILDGPHVETEHYNFEALNIPKDHPARDMQDTFWFTDLAHLLRTHTSAVQARGMEKYTPPFKFIAPGKCFRCERTDASHEMVFHQLEGMMVGKDVSVGHLIFFMTVILKEIFRRDVKVRLRPGFFPFVEPGFELDINCLICAGRGCSVCKHSGWVELLPCGMVHPEVLKMGGIDPTQYSGFAFGLGLDRLLMMRFGLNDIRLIHSGDLRFISQFKSI